MGYCRPLFFLSHILFVNLVGLTIAQPDFITHVCSGNNDTNSMYEANKNTLLSSLSSNIDRYGFYNSSVGQNSDRLNAIALCQGDVELDICRSCVKDSTRRLVQRCPNYKVAIGWNDNCMLRFSNYFIFNTVQTRPASFLYNLNNVSDVAKFDQALRTLLDSLRRKAASGGSLRKFASGNTSGPDFQTIYALLQCTPDLSELQCSDCLDGAAGEIPQCCNGRSGARILKPSCNLRYETSRFDNETLI